MERAFSCWPLKKKPSFASYSWKESKWCRMCHENFDYIMEYLSILLDEHVMRFKSEHIMTPAHEWLQCAMQQLDFPYAKLKSVVLPWKVVDPRFRCVDLVEGYRKAFISQLEDGDPFKAYERCARDIPQFVLEKSNVVNAFES